MAGKLDGKVGIAPEEFTTEHWVSVRHERRAYPL